MKPVLDLREVAMGVLGELDGVVGARYCRLQVALDGADCGETRASRAGFAGEAGQSVGDDSQRSHEVLVYKGGHRLFGERPIRLIGLSRQSGKGSGIFSQRINKVPGSASKAGR